MNKYYILQIIWDIIRFKLRIKHIKQAMKVYELYDDIVLKKERITFKHIKKILKLKISDIKTTLKIHNRYVKDSEDRISLPSLQELFLEINKVVPQFQSNRNSHVLTKILEHHLKNIQK